GMGLRFQHHKLGQVETRRWLFFFGVVAVKYLLFQSLLLPYGNALHSILPDIDKPIYDKNSLPIVHSSKKSVVIRNPLTVDTSKLTNDSKLDEVAKDADFSDGFGDTGHASGPDEKSGDRESSLATDEEDLENFIEPVVDRILDDDFPSEIVMNKNE